MRRLQRNAGSDVAKTIASAKPIHRKTEPFRKRLLVAGYRADLRTSSVLPVHQGICPAGKARTVITFKLLAEHRVAETEGIRACAIGNRRVQYASHPSRRSFAFIVMKLPLDIRLHFDRLAATGDSRVRDVCAYFEIVANADDGTRKKVVICVFPL